jgi:hypothetical protein
MRDRNNAREPQSDNPKRDPYPGSNTANDPSAWVSGGEPMTGAQANYLKTLSEEAREPEAFTTNLSKAEASRRIHAFKAKLRLQDGPPHTL